MDRPSATGSPPDADALYGDAPCGLLVTAEDGAIQRVNRTFCNWSGFDAAELVGRMKLQDLLTMGGRIFHQTHWGPLMQIQGSVAEVKLEIVHKGGRRLPTVWNAVRRVRDDSTVHELAVFIAEDRHKYEHELLLARRRAEELLHKEQQTQLALGEVQVERDRQQALAQDRARFAEQMMAIVSHDLRNPLAVIHMSAHILSRTALSDKQDAALRRLVRSNERALRLIADLLDFSRGHMGGGLQVTKVRIDFHGVVADALEDLRVATPGQPIVHQRSGTGMCFASIDRLAQLIGNLVLNAIAYGKPGRPVVVRSAIDAQAFSIAVHNEGQPIAPDLLPRLFDPMTRGAPAAGHGSSVGLGLFIVREIAHAHGGAVDVVSAAGDGTTFTARFPRAASPALHDPLQPAGHAADDPRQGAPGRPAIDASPDADFDDIVRLAAEACDVPMAWINLVDGGRHWLKAGVGFAATDSARHIAFCAQAVRAPADVFVVEDAAADVRFAADPMVTGEPGIRFYAGAPLLTDTGVVLGTVAVVDRAPRTLDAKQRELLKFLARQVVEMLEQKNSAF